MLHFTTALALVFSFVFFDRAEADYRTNIYTENSYVAHAQAGASQLRARAGKEIASGISTFLQLGQEVFSGMPGQALVDLSSSYAYAAPGIEWSLGKFHLYGEGRVRRFYATPIAAASPSPLDIRLMLVYGDSSFRPLGVGRKTSVFHETYTEAVFTSADSSNWIVSSFFRVGIRQTLARSFYCDVFVEPFLGFDRIGHFYNNRAELRPSLRLQYWNEGVAVGLSASYLTAYYLPIPTREPNPFDRISSGARILATAGVTL